jgi:hypothetical protein
MRVVLLISSRFISQRSRFGLYGRQVALTNRAATVPMSELCPAPAPFLAVGSGSIASKSLVIVLIIFAHV